MSIQDRYATAVRSSCLTVDARTTYSDTDVLGAMGLASKQSPLAAMLLRLFTGDNTASREIVGVLEQMAWRKARGLRVKLTLQQARHMAQTCLHWHRDNVCKNCGGHGKMKIPNTNVVGNAICKECRGTGRVSFDKQFRHEWRELAAWLVAEMETEQAQAGPAAMRQLASYLDMKQKIEEAVR